MATPFPERSGNSYSYLLPKLDARFDLLAASFGVSIAYSISRFDHCCALGAGCTSPEKTDTKFSCSLQLLIRPLQGKS